MFDNEFMNSAYLSEKWAALDITERLDSGNFDPQDEDFLIQQERDETRHAKMILRAIEKYDPDYEIVHDLEYAMQSVLHLNVGGIDINTGARSYEYFRRFHEVMEKRAVFIYKTYIRGGHNTYFKKILIQIIRDELEHRMMKLEQDDHIVVRDHFIFHNHIPREFGDLNLVDNEEFWKAYYGGEMSLR